MFIIAILTWVSFIAIPILIFKAVYLGFSVIAFVALLIVEIGVFFAVNTKMGCQLGDFPPLIALWVFFAICFIIISIIKKAIDSQKKIKLALEKLKESANQGDAKAQIELGNKYESGDGVPRDYAEAVKWYRSAAEQGYAEAQVKLGSAYESGDGVPMDYREAVKWYRNAAEQGHVKAQVKLASAYERGGDGVPMDYPEAVKWYRSAAEKGYALAQCNILRLHMEEKRVPQDREYFAWVKKGCHDEMVAKKFMGALLEDAKKSVTIPRDITSQEMDDENAALWEQLDQEFEEVRQKASPEIQKQMDETRRLIKEIRETDKLIKLLHKLREKDGLELGPVQKDVEKWLECKFLV